MRKDSENQPDRRMAQAVGEAFLSGFIEGWTQSPEGGEEPGAEEEERDGLELAELPRGLDGMRFR